MILLMSWYFFGIIFLLNLPDKSSLPTALYHADQVRALDKTAIEEYSIAGITLMERAGSAAFEFMRKQWPAAKNILALSGPGNNGGDAYVLARLAYEAGYSVRLLQVGKKKLAGTAAIAAEKLAADGFIAEKYTPGQIGQCDLIIDALLGTGLDRPLSGEWVEVIATINQYHSPVFSIDIPSGLNADTGQPMPSAVKADATLSFIGLKQGLFTGEGREYAGAIHFHNLEVPEVIYTKIKPAAELITLENCRTLLPPRSRTSHKGDFGHVLVVGGTRGFVGASYLAGEAAARVGAGLVSLATQAQQAMTPSLTRPEIMHHPIEEAAQLIPLLKNTSVVAVGPGLGQTKLAHILLAKVLESDHPMVVDADALNLLAGEPAYSKNWILTPHPGEAARLLACAVNQIQSDRVAAAKALQLRYGGVIILKGSGTVIVDDNSVRICQDGNPGMAGGGMGDVLTGLIAGLLAQGLELANAAVLGVCLHAAAADKSAVDGERGMLASDLMPWIRKLINDSA